MGYRSNGGIVIFGPEPEMIANLTALRMTQTNPEPWNGELTELRLYRDAGNLVWHLEYSDWKMYEGYPDVDELNRIYRESAHFAALSGYKWRFGEDDDDVEHDVFGDSADSDICCINKELSADFPGVAFVGQHADEGEFYLIGDCRYAEVIALDGCAREVREILRCNLPANLHPHIQENGHTFTLAAQGLSAVVVEVLTAFGESLFGDTSPEVYAAWGYAARRFADTEPVRRGTTYSDRASININNTVTHLYQAAYNDPVNYPDVAERKESAA